MEKTELKHPLMLPKLLMGAKQLLITVADKYELTSMQVCMLILVEPGSSRTMSSLARTLRNDASNITGLADRLEKQKLVTRRDDPDDRRVKIIRLTPQGEKTRTSIMADVKEAESSLLSNLSDQEKQTFRELLHKL